MIQAHVIKNKKKKQAILTVSGHAGFAAKGFDIVCSAVSVLTFHTKMACAGAKEDDSDGKDKITFPLTHDNSLLLDAYVNTMSALASQYPNNVMINYEWQ